MAFSKRPANALKFVSLAALEVKFEGFSVHGVGLAEYLNHIDPRPADDAVFDVLHRSALGLSLPDHIHLGVAAKVFEDHRRELALLSRYDRRLKKQARPATETEQRRIRVIAYGVFARCALQQVQEAMIASYAEYLARQKATSAKEAV